MFIDHLCLLIIFFYRSSSFILPLVIILGFSFGTAFLILVISTSFSWTSKDTIFSFNQGRVPLIYLCNGFITFPLVFSEILLAAKEGHAIEDYQLFPFQNKLSEHYETINKQRYFTAVVSFSCIHVMHLIFTSLLLVFIIFFYNIYLDL